MKKLLLGVTMLSLIGCASGPTFSDYSKRLPPRGKATGEFGFIARKKYWGQPFNQR